MALAAHAPQLVWIGIALLAGRAGLLGITVPLAAGYYGALRRSLPRAAPAAAFALIAGALSAGEYWTALRIGLAVLAVRAAAGHLSRASTAGRTERWRSALTAGGFVAAAVAATQIPGVLIAGLSPMAFLVAAVEVGAAFVASVVLHLGMQELTGGSRLGLLRGESLLALLVLLAVSLAGLAGFRLAGLPLAAVAGGLLVMLMARAGGGAVGALAGVTVGIVVGFTGETSPAQIGVWAVAGMLAGIGGDFGTLGAVAGFGLGTACLAGMVREAGYLRSALWQAGAASLVFLLLPARLVSRARLVCRGPDAAEQGAEMSNALWLLAAHRLTVLAGVFKELAQAFEEPAATLSAAVGAETVLASARPSAPAVSVPGGGPSCGHNAVSTAYATEARRLLSRQLQGVSGITADLAAQMSLGDIPAGLLRAREVEDALAGAGCPVRQAVLAPAQHGFEIHVQCKPWPAGLMGDRCEWCAARAADIVRPVVGRRMSLSRRLCAPPSPGCYFMLVTEPRYRLEVGRAKAAHEEALVSGDTVVSRRVGGFRHLLLLSDGMGTGLNAARESVTAVRMVEAMLDAGFDLETTMHTINAALFLRSPREAFATVDLALADLADGRLDMVKVGACPSYLWRDGQVALLEAKGPPLGILDSVPISGLHARMRPGDILVMVSDGVFGGRAGLPRRHDWLRRAISRHAPERSPQELAEDLLMAAAERQRNGRGDDMTILVAGLRRPAGSG